MKTWTALGIFVLLHSRYRRRSTTYDILIRGGRVLDGSGNPCFPNDIAIQNGRIAAVGQLDGASASRIIDADVLSVTPGFIDMHSHANSGFDDEERRAKATVNNLTQGITTVWPSDSTRLSSIPLPRDSSQEPRHHRPERPLGWLSPSTIAF